MAVARLQQRDIEPLSPRSANIQLKVKPSKYQEQKEMSDEEAKKAEAARKAAKEKEYAPPPPEWVIQPPLLRGGLAEKFKTGRLLGKGGFAIAYEGELRSKKSGANKSVFALKIVRAKMSQRKMEEKVTFGLSSNGQATADSPHSLEQSSKFTRRCDIPTLSSSTALLPTRKAPMSCSRCVLTGRSWTWSRRDDV